MLNTIIMRHSYKNGNNQRPPRAGVHATQMKQLIAHECLSKIDKNYKTINRKIQKRRLYLLNVAKWSVAWEIGQNFLAGGIVN